MSKKQSSKDHKAEADKVVRNINRQTRRKFNSEEKIRIVLSGLRGEESTSEVKELRKENSHLKEALAEEILEHRLLKKSEILGGEDDI
jgi:transposase